MSTKAERIKERLKNVDAAINRVLTAGQRIKTPTSEVENASLAALREECLYLEQQLAQEEGNGSSNDRMVKGFFCG